MEAVGGGHYDEAQRVIQELLAEEQTQSGDKSRVFNLKERGEIRRSRESFEATESQ